jgi:5-methylcytosine-specific restriction protein A
MPTRPPIHRPLGQLRSAQSESDRERGSASARGYDRLWRKFRQAFLAEHPLCADCEREGLITVATEVHHREKLVKRPDLRLDPANATALCTPCHSIRTARGE